jgi:hypothetical protein
MVGVGISSFHNETFIFWVPHKTGRVSRVRSGSTHESTAQILVPRTELLTLIHGESHHGVSQ